MWITGEELCKRWRITLEALEGIIKDNSVPLYSPLGKTTTIEEMSHKAFSRMAFRRRIPRRGLYDVSLDKENIAHVIHSELMTYRIKLADIYEVESVHPTLLLNSEKKENKKGSWIEKAKTYTMAAIRSKPDIPSRQDLALEIKETFPEEMPDIRQIIPHIAPLFPDYTPLKPGRKRGNTKKITR